MIPLGLKAPTLRDPSGWLLPPRAPAVVAPGLGELEAVALELAQMGSQQPTACLSPALPPVTLGQQLDVSIVGVFIP